MAKNITDDPTAIDASITDNPAAGLDPGLAADIDPGPDRSDGAALVFGQNGDGDTPAILGATPLSPRFAAATQIMTGVAGVNSVANEISEFSSSPAIPTAADGLDMGLIENSVVTPTGIGITLATVVSSHIDANGDNATGGLLSTAENGVIQPSFPAISLFENSTSYGLSTGSGTFVDYNQSALDGTLTSQVSGAASPVGGSDAVNVSPGPLINIVDIIPTVDSGEADANSEPSVAVNPLNTRQIIAGAFDLPGKTGTPSTPFFLSADGGATWSDFANLSTTDDKTLAWKADGSGFLAADLTPGFDIQTFSGTVSSSGLGTAINTFAPASPDNLDQPWLRTGTSNHVYLAFNNRNNVSTLKTASVNISTDGGSTYTTAVIDRTSSTLVQDAPAVRLAVNGNTVYGIFTRWVSTIENESNGDSRYTSNVVVVRSDNAGADSFTALGGGGVGTVAASPTGFNGGGINTPLTLGQERTASDVAIAVDPKNANHVVIAYSDAPGANESGQLQLIVAESTDAGATWTTRFTTPSATRSAQPGLAILPSGTIGLLYNNYDPTTDTLQQHLIETADHFTNWTDSILATESNATPVVVRNPYLGDFFDLEAVGNNFYGVFSASNADDGTNATFNSGVTFQRKFTGTPGTSNFQLTDGSGNPVGASIDPFFFSASGIGVTPTRSRTFTGRAGNLDWNGALRQKNPDGSIGAIIYTNWSSLSTERNPDQGVPGPADDLDIGFDGNFAVFLNTDTNLAGLPNAADSLTIRAGSSLTLSAKLLLGNGTTNNNVSLDNSSTLVLTDSQVLTLSNTVINAGTITLHSYQSGRTALDIAGDVTLRGGGHIGFITDAYNLGEITGSTSTLSAILHNADNTIAGGGNIFAKANNFVLDNQGAGIIKANDPSLQMNVHTLTIDNAGVIEATDHGTLNLTNVTISQTNIGIIGASGGTIVMTDDQVIGGLLTTTDLGTITFVGTANGLDGSTAAGAVTNLGALTLHETAIVTLSGTIANQGQITLHAYQSGNTGLHIAGDVLLQGHGNIVMVTDSYNQNDITGASPTATATLHNFDNTISGFGTFETQTNKFALDNQAAGTINANDDGNQIIFGGTAPVNNGNTVVSTLTVSNAGLIEDTGKAGLKMTHVSFSQSSSGTLSANGKGSHIDLDHTVLSGGTFSSSGGGFFNIVGAGDVLDGSTTPFNNAGLFNVPDGQALTIEGTINNTGTITSSAYQSGRTAIEVLGDVRLQGHGHVVLQTAAYNQNDITGSDLSVSGSVLHNFDNTISGLGTFETRTHPFTFDNAAAGVVNADDDGNQIIFGTGPVVSNSNTLVNTLTVSNAGLIEATGKAGLKMTYTAFTQTGKGALTAGPGSRIELDHTVLSGGTFSSTGTGLFNVVGSGAVLDGSTTPFNDAALFNIPDGQVLTLQGNTSGTGTGTINNTGTVALSGYQSGATTLDVAGDLTLQGNGVIILTTAAYNQDVITGSSLTSPAILHNAGNTIMGLGVIGGSNKLIFDNASGGTVNANNVGNTLTIGTGATVTNSGTLEAVGGMLIVNDALNNASGGGLVDATAGGSVTLNGAVGNNGVLEADGGTLVVSDTVTGTGHLLITNGGTAIVNGAFQQDVTFSGAGTLVLPEAAAAKGGYIGHISGWGAGDTVDVPGVAFSNSYRVLIGNGSSVSFQGLFVVDITKNNALIANMNLNGGNFISRNFSLADDGHGGLSISEHAAGPVPTPTKLALSAASDSGAKGDDATNIKTPVITGTGELSDTLTLFDTYTAANGKPVTVQVGSATVAVDGTWSVTATTLSSGLHNLTATESDPLGNASPVSTALSLTILPAPSPAVLNDFSWTEGWGSPNNPRLTADVNRDGTTDYLGFGFNAVFIGYGGTFAGTNPSQTGPGFSPTAVGVVDFGTNEGYTAVVQRGAAAAGVGVGDVLYGQGFLGVYWYAATSATPQTDAAGNAYNVLQYETAPHLYGNFGTSQNPADHQGWSPANGFQILKSTASDPFASILGFGGDGIWVGPQAFAPGADASASYLIPLGAGNNSGWNAQNDVRTFTDAKGNTIDLNHDGIADFVGMGPQGLTFAFGSNSGGKYQLGMLQYAKLNGTSDDPNISDDLGDNKGWNNTATLRNIVADPQTGFYDILAFGDFGVVVAPGQDPATHNGQPFGQLYLAMPDFGANQGWSVQQTPRIVGDVNGDGIPDIVGFGADNTFAALGSRDAGGTLHFAFDSNLTIGDFGFNEGWSFSDPQTVRTLGTFKTGGSSVSDLILSGGGNNFTGVETQVLHYT